MARVAATGLNERQVRFAQQYLIDLNATQAYIRAGYSPEGARQSASRLLADADVSAYVARLQTDAARRARITLDAIVAETARLAFSDLRMIVRGHGGALERLEALDDDAAAPLQSVKLSMRPSGEVDDDGRPIYEDVIEYKLAPKLAALEALRRQLGLGGGNAGDESVAEVLRDLASKLPD